jgi:NAD(P)-dependent dehydrogenase (short-subunit alcohol dehydrogenase family)
MSKAAKFHSLANRSVLITGGASGIGKALVEAFARQGAKTAFLDLDVSAGKKLQDSLREETGSTVVFGNCDLKDIDALQKSIVALAEETGAFEVLVNNAANDTRHDWRDVTPEYWDDRVAVNLRHYFFAIQAVAPGMIEAGGGSIINLGSVSWMLAQGGMPCYTTSKSAVQGLTRSFARDLGPHGIRVNTLVPGWVMTERQLELWVDEAGERTMDEQMCLKGRVKPHDIANAALFFAADESAMCSAQSLIVDGGWV